jgi:hypothetical protein
VPISSRSKRFAAGHAGIDVGRHHCAWVLLLLRAEERPVKGPLPDKALFIVSSIGNFFTAFAACGSFVA